MKNETAQGYTPLWQDGYRTLSPSTPIVKVLIEKGLESKLKGRL